LVNTTGHDNTASGLDALFSNTTGARNTAYGDASLLNVTTGSDNIALGYNAGWLLKAGNNNIDIGAAGRVPDSNTIRIGERETHQTTSIAGISGATVADGVTVVVGADGHLGRHLVSRTKEGVSQWITRAKRFLPYSQCLSLQEELDQVFPGLAHRQTGRKIQLWPGERTTRANHGYGAGTRCCSMNSREHRRWKRREGK
jgi:hypothetical protein